MTFGLGRSFGLILSVAVVVVLMVASLKLMVLIHLHLFSITVCSRSTQKESAVVFYLFSVYGYFHCIEYRAQLCYGHVLCELLAYDEWLFGDETSMGGTVEKLWRVLVLAANVKANNPCRVKTEPLLARVSQSYGSNKRSGVWISDVVSDRDTPLVHMVFVGKILHSFSGCSIEYSTWTFADQNPVKVAPEMVSESINETLASRNLFSGCPLVKIGYSTWTILHRHEKPLESFVSNGTVNPSSEVCPPNGRLVGRKSVGSLGSHKQHRFNMLGRSIINKNLSHNSSYIESSDGGLRIHSLL